MLALRVHRLLEPVTVTWDDGYGGCTSWVELAGLPDDPASLPSRPALSDVAFAARLKAWEEQGAPEILFLLGGADGLSPDLRSQANFVLSLGQMTWPHLLARAMLVEQIYRAQQILAGHPYHRD